MLLDETEGLSWKGDETASLIFGKKGTDNFKNPVICSVEPGIFEGEITIPEGYTLDDLQGIAVPAENNANFRGDHSDGKRLRMLGYTSQKQAKDGEYNPMYAPFFAPLSKDRLVPVENDSYSIPSVKLLSGHDLIRFNVFGKHTDSKPDEYVQSISVTASNKLCCTFEYNLEKSGVGTNGNSYGTVTLENPVLVPSSKADGVKMFLGVSLGGNRTVTEVVVTTDKAVYTKKVSQTLSQKKDLSALNVYKANIDLSTFTRKDTERENYYKRKVLSITKRAGLPSMQVTWTKGREGFRADHKQRW